MKDVLLQGAKLVLLAVPAFILWGILYASPAHTDYTVLRARIEDAVELEGMAQADVQLLRRLYGLNGEEFANWSLWTAEDNMAVEELLLVECASAEQAEQVRQAAQARVDTQIQNFEGYGPEQVQLLRENVTEVRNTYVLFVVSKQAGEVKDAFMETLYPQISRLKKGHGQAV